jgi:hypothetical protein
VAVVEVLGTQEPPYLVLVVTEAEVALEAEVAELLV